LALGDWIVMAWIKPGTVVRGFLWTGTRWVKEPQITADKVRLRREVEKNLKNTDPSLGQASKRIRDFQMRKAKATYPGGSSRGVSGGDKPKAAPTTPPKPGAKPKPSADRLSGADSTKKVTKPKKDDKKVPAKPVVKPGASTGTPSRPAATQKTQAKKTPQKKPAVSQSRTMWVAKGTEVGGKKVEKGYLAQYGRPEKKVSAPVKLVTETKRGKAGDVVKYQKGRYKKK